MKIPTVEDEHDIEVVELLIGSAFVLGQTAITQAVSISPSGSLRWEQRWTSGGLTRNPPESNGAAFLPGRFSRTAE
jgi:hypothetical protein